MNKTNQLKRQRWFLNLRIRLNWRKAGRLTKWAICAKSHRRRERIFKKAQNYREAAYQTQDELMATYGIQGYAPPPKFIQGFSVKHEMKKTRLKLVWVSEDI